MTAKQIAVKKYIVKLNHEDQERLDALIHAGKHPARQLIKARILLAVDASEAGEGWSDSQIAPGRTVTTRNLSKPIDTSPTPTPAIPNRAAGGRMRNGYPATTANPRVKLRGCIQQYKRLRILGRQGYRDPFLNSAQHRMR